MTCTEIMLVFLRGSAPEHGLSLSSGTEVKGEGPFLGSWFPGLQLYASSPVLPILMTAFHRWQVLDMFFL